MHVCMCSLQEVVSFQDLSAGVSKRVAAGCFLEVLQLKTWGRIRVQQEAPFSDILISAL
jgi:chromatin segregation and condensation protein Rec8/ScpA/Scc1 (kleisin family)